MSETPTFDFDAFVSGATITEMSVDIFQNGAVLGKFDEWQRRYERAQQLADEPSGERSAGEADPVAALEAEGEQLLSELEASKTVWFLRALTSEDENAINAAHPAPESPIKKWTEPAPTPIKNATEKQAEAFITAYTSWAERRDSFMSEQTSSKEYEAYAKETSQVLLDRGAEKIQRAFVRIEKDGMVVGANKPTIEQIKNLPAAIGEVQVGKLIAAIDAATKAEPEVPGDFLHRTSKIDLG